MSDKIRLYLDVDGVINAPMAGSKWDGDQTEGFAVAENYQYRIRWSPSMIKALDELDLDLVWTTTWRTDAVKSIAPLIGFGGVGRVLHPDDDPEAETYFPSIDWKVVSVAKDQERDPSPFVWLDDEIGESHIRIAGAMGGLAVAPEHYYGISPQDIEQIRKYAALLDGAFL